MESSKEKEIDDQRLLDNFYKDHNNEWLGMLLPKYTFLLLGVCMKYLKNEEDAKDSVQQIFLKVIGELQKYQVQYFKSWLYMIAKNHCLMKLRDKGKYNLELTPNLDIGSDDIEDKSVLVEKNATLDQLQNALLHLNKEQQLCITLFYLEKRSYAEICNVSEFTLLQVKSHIQNGKRNLKMILSKKQHE